MLGFVNFIRRTCPSGPLGSAEKYRQIIALILGVAFLSACGGGGGGGSSSPVSPSWEGVDLPINLIESVAVNPLDRRVVYAGQRNPLMNAEHAIWRSDDGGESFQVVAKGVSFHLFPSPTDPDRVLGTVKELDSHFGGQALYLSRDRGQNWQPVLKDGKGILLSEFNPGGNIGQHPSQRDTIYVHGRLRDGLDWGVFKSTDGGETWVNVTPQVLLDSNQINFFFDPLHVDTVFLSARFTAPDGSAGVLLRTVDGGKSWQPADAGLLVRSSEGLMAHQLSKLVVTTVTGVLVGVSNFGQLWINSDGGHGTWRPLPLPLGSVDQFLWSAKIPYTLVVLTRDGEMMRSDDLGSNWQPVATPGKIFASSLDDSNSLGVLITTVNDEALYRTEDAGRTWTLLPKPKFRVGYYPGDGYSGYRVAISVAAQDRLVAFRASYGTLPRLDVLTEGKWQMPRGMEAFRSTVAATSIAAFGNRLAAAAGGALFQQDSQGVWGRMSLTDGAWSEGARLSSDGDRRGIFGGLYYAIHGLYGSLFQGTTDGGEHWATENRFNGYSGEAVFDTANGRFWYLATSNMIGWEVFLVEADGSIKKSSAGLPSGPLNALANSPQAPSRLYVGTSQGIIYRSTDGGAMWNPAFTGGSGSPVSTIAVDPKNPMIVWALGTAGLVRSNDGGDHWTAVAAELFSSGGSALALHPSRSGTVVVSAASGIWVSVDAGAKWQNIGGPDMRVRQILIVDDAINVATDNGLFRCKSLCQLL